jgi:glyceraldehyde 3-phosphate dehydrogenase
LVNIGINGFGRIGRCAFRAAIGDPNVSIVAVNGTRDPKILAHLLKYDSNYGVLKESIEIESDGIIIGGKKTFITTERNIGNLKWDRFNVDVVIESTGVIRDRETAAKHIENGAKKVIISAPAKNEDITIVLGVNEDAYNPGKHHIISMGSCTTNCLAPVAKVLQSNFGIEKGFMVTVHSYTMDQRLLDGTHEDLRRGRSAATSIVPTTTGAARAISLVLPELKGRLNGYAVRVPTPTVSMIDLAVQTSKTVTSEEINRAFKEASARNLKGILDIRFEPLVSTDFKGDSHSAIVDGFLTATIGNLVKVVAWYDNEWAFSRRLVEMATYMQRMS